MSRRLTTRHRRLITEARRNSILPEMLEARTLFSVPEPNDNFAQSYIPQDIEQYYLTANYQASDQVTAGQDVDYFHFFSLYGVSRAFVRLSGHTADCDV